MMNWKRFGRKGLWPSSGTILTFAWGIEGNLEGPQDDWHPAQDSN